MSVSLSPTAWQYGEVVLPGAAADVRVRVLPVSQSYLECRSKSKKYDEQLTHIVRYV